MVGKKEEEKEEEEGEEVRPHPVYFGTFLRGHACIAAAKGWFSHLHLLTTVCLELF